MTLGFKVFKVTMFIIPAIIGFLCLLWLIGIILSAKPEIQKQTKWIIFGWSIVGALIIGILWSVFRKIGIWLVGSALGAFAFMLIYNAALFMTPTMVLYFGMAGWGILTGILAFILFNHIIITTTSFIGSYLFIRGISVFAGGFPN